MDRINLERDLPRYGCDVDADEFRDAVQELKAVMYPNWTDEEMLFHLDDSRAYVMAVRSRVKCAGLPDWLILKTLVNCRKHELVGRGGGSDRAAAG